jgi:predicted ATPase/DNA-binding CsgD family transcriptional regulator
MAVAPTRITSNVGNLPVELTSFVGRRQGLADLKRALASTRLLTLTGAGGVGKTKLALRAGRETTRQYPDGVWFVELAPIQDPELVPQAVFTALGLQDHSSSWAVSTLSDYLTAKRPLLILDNCEHVHDAAAVLAGTLLRACPDLRILATSRQALGVTGEVVIDVPTLSLPDDADASPESLLRSDAVTLFVERATAVQPGFAVDATNAAAILSICTHVDGIPLALELAAVRLNALGLDALDRGLSARLGALGTGDRSAAPRQQTLEGAIDWSYQLLSEHERLLWARLSVFAGGFELDAAQAVCAGDGLDAVEIPELVGSLVEKSVLKRQQGDGPNRFRLLEPLRQFGHQRLREAGAETILRTRHRDWIIELANIAGANDARQVEAFERIRIERANLWSALDFCLSDPAEAESGAAICEGLWPYWASQGPATEVRSLYAALLQRIPGPTRARGQLLWISSFAAASQGDQSAALRSGTEALAIGRRIGDPEVVAWALQSLGVTAYLTNRWDDSIAYATETLALARTMGWRFTALSAATLLGVARTFRGELDAAIAIARDGIRSSEELGETWERAYLLHFLAVALLHKGEPAEAEVHARQSLELKRALGDLIGMASAVEALALIAMSRGSSERSATLLGAAEAIWRSVPTTILEPFRADHDRTEADARVALGSANFETAHRAGLEMTRDEVVDYVLEVRPSAARPVARQSESSEGPLSRREMEVAELVADGATNSQVAARLFISERTVESHVASIFNKLGVDTRLQVARWFASMQETSTT